MALALQPWLGRLVHFTVFETRYFLALERISVDRPNLEVCESGTNKYSDCEQIEPVSALLWRRVA